MYEDIFDASQPRILIQTCPHLCVCGVDRIGAFDTCCNSPVCSHRDSLVTMSNPKRFTLALSAVHKRSSLEACKDQSANRHRIPTSKLDVEI